MISTRVAQRPGLVATAIAFAITATFALRVGEIPLWHESADAWWYPSHERSILGGPWAFLGAGIEHTGYLPPLIGWLASKSSSLVSAPEWVAMRLTSAAAVAVLASHVVPKLIELVTGISATLPRRLMLVAMVLAFWRGMALYPTPVLGATLLTLTAVLLALRWASHHDAARGWLARGAWLAVGVAIGAGILYHSGSQVVIPLIVVIGVVGARNREIDVVAPMTWALIGAVAILIPQSGINSLAEVPLNPLRSQEIDARSTFTHYIDQGVEMTHETRFASTSAINSEMQQWPDPGARERRAQLVDCCIDPAVGVLTYLSYAEGVVRHPVMFSESMTRHAKAAFDLRYTTPFPTRDEKRGAAFRVASALTFLAAIVALLGIRLGRIPLSARPNTLIVVSFWTTLVVVTLLALLGPVRHVTLFPVYLVVYGIAVGLVPARVREG